LFKFTLNMMSSSYIRSPMKIIIGTLMVVFCMQINAQPEVNITSIVNGQRQLQTDNGTIIGGTDAPWDKYPSFAYFPVHGCGGTLIRHDMVLTTASCIALMDGHTSVYIGGTQIYGGTQHAIKNMWVHPQYNDISMESDIAIVQLKCSSTSKTMKMNFDPMIPAAGSEVWAVGYGRQSDGYYAIDLQELLMKTYSNRYCRRQHKSPLRRFYGDVMVCAGFDKDGYGPCENDLGGPLILDMNTDGEILMQVGILSWSEGYCGASFDPWVYTRLSTYRRFIFDVIRKNSNKIPSYC
jgi:trypsin